MLAFVGLSAIARLSAHFAFAPDGDEYGLGQMLHVLLHLKADDGKVKLFSGFARSCVPLVIPHKWHDVMMVSGLAHSPVIGDTFAPDFILYCRSKMSSTGFSASVTWTVKPINGTGNGYVKRVTLSREWSDSGSRRSRYQNRSENVIDILRYYWIVSVVGMAILYWCKILWPRWWPGLTFIAIYRALLATKSYFFELDTSSWGEPGQTRWIIALYAPGLFRELIPFSSAFGACVPVDPCRYSRKPRRRTLRFLRVCLVTRGINIAVGHLMLSVSLQPQELHANVHHL